MAMEDIPALDAVGQAELVKSGQASPGDLIEAAIAQIKTQDVHIGALVHTRFEAARSEARKIERTSVFAGVPILLKDAPPTLQKGLPHSSGNRVLKKKPIIVDQDSPLGARVRELGFITLGVTKVPELCWWTTTQPVAFGPARNPWNQAYSTGGSSGGSAAAVASRMVPVATGTEDAGSIRIPAAFCGVVGFKPTRGLVPMPEPHTYHRLHAFALCRTIRDCRALLEGVATGSRRGLFPAETAAPDADGLIAALPRLRIGIARKACGVEADPECQAALEATIPVLEKLGFAIVDRANAAITDHEPDPERILPRCGALAGLRYLENLIGREITQDDVEPFLLHLANRDAPEPTAFEFAQAQDRRRAWAVNVLRLWDEVDILISPTVCEPPVTLASRAAETPEETVETERRQMAFALAANETGQPAISLPLFWSRDGLPIGIQLTGDLGGDHALLNVAARLEQVYRWNDRAPLRTDELNPSSSSHT